MKSFYLTIRSALLWAMSILHFFVFGPLLVAFARIVGPRRADSWLYFFFRNVLILTGARSKVLRSPGFDPHRPSFFVCNHVNVFDAMTIKTAIPQPLSGVELESHFKVPVYGWIIDAWNNIHVAEQPSAASNRRLTKECRQTLEDGVSIIVFAEATRTLTGRLGRFHPGVFRMACEFGVPVVPMSIVGAFEHKHKGDWMLRPASITVHLHDTIETGDLTRRDASRLMARVHETVNGPIRERYPDESSGSSGS